jgi:AraC-like DNA-binding protein
MSATPLHNEPIPFITLPNWVKAASQCGFNIQPIFRELGIQTDLIHLESATIERGLLEKAMGACVAKARSQPGPQRQHFPFVLGETFAFEYLPDIETFVTTSMTLREAVPVFVWVRELINPMLQVHLEEEGRSARLVLNFAGLDSTSTPRPWFSESMFAAILKFGRLLKKDGGWVRQLSFRHPAPDYAEIYEPFFQAPVKFGEPRYALEFERSLLDLPLDGGFPALHEQARQRVEQRLKRLPRRGTLVASIEQAFARKTSLLAQGVESMAAELELHPRTLQRRLRDEGESYGELCDRVRYRLAQQCLSDPGQAIEDISERLGFSDRRSFTRAFTRWSGVSPSSYRKRPAAL